MFFKTQALKVAQTVLNINGLLTRPKHLSVSVPTVLEVGTLAGGRWRKMGTVLRRQTEQLS